jgi:hypothetical protein
VALGALMADAYTSYAALTAPHHAYVERTPAVAGLVASYGIAGGLLASVFLRFAAFAVLALVARQVPRTLSRPVLACGYVGALFTWWIALQNVWTIAHSGV